MSPVYRVPRQLILPPAHTYTMPSATDRDTYELFAKQQVGIAPGDVAPALRCMLKNPTADEEAGFPKGPVDETKLAQLAGSVGAGISAEDVITAFQVFDKNAAGTVMSNEVKAELTRMFDDDLIPDMREEDVDEMMAILDSEKTGTIDYSVFVEKMMSIEKFEGLPPLNPDDVMI